MQIIIVAISAFHDFWSIDSVQKSKGAEGVRGCEFWYTLKFC